MSKRKIKNKRSSRYKLAIRRFSSGKKMYPKDIEFITEEYNKMTGKNLSEYEIMKFIEEMRKESKCDMRNLVLG